MKSVSWNEHVRLAQKQSKRVGRKWAVILITCLRAFGEVPDELRALPEGRVRSPNS